MDFDKLLDWLHPDRERAAQKYDEIHGNLVRIFSWRGHHDAEELADEAVNRVVSKVEDISPTYVGDPALYFYGVAKKILLECERRDPPRPLTPELMVADALAHEDEDEDEGVRLRDSLHRCLRRLPPEDRELILSYYQKSKQSKIDYRKALAEQLGMETNTLRVKVYRIRQTLKTCIKSQVGRHRAVK